MKIPSPNCLQTVVPTNATTDRQTFRALFFWGESKCYVVTAGGSLAREEVQPEQNRQTQRFFGHSEKYLRSHIFWNCPWSVSEWVSQSADVRSRQKPYFTTHMIYTATYTEFREGGNIEREKEEFFIASFFFSTIPLIFFPFQIHRIWALNPRKLFPYPRISSLLSILSRSFFSEKKNFKHFNISSIIGTQD